MIVPKELGRSVLFLLILRLFNLLLQETKMSALWQTTVLLLRWFHFRLHDCFYHLILVVSTLSSLENAALHISRFLTIVGICYFLYPHMLIFASFSDVLFFLAKLSDWLALVTIFCWYVRVLILLLHCHCHELLYILVQSWRSYRWMLIPLLLLDTTVEELLKFFCMTFIL